MGNIGQKRTISSMSYGARLTNFQIATFKLLRPFSAFIGKERLAEKRKLPKQQQQQPQKEHPACSDAVFYF